MDEVLNLSITLKPPPADAQPDALASIELHYGQQGLTHSGDMLLNPLSEKEETDLRWYLEEYWMWPYEQFRERAEAIEAFLPQLGKRLYHAVFQSIGSQEVLQSWRLQSGGASRQISIVSDIPRVLSLPWELLHDEQGFLALRTGHPASIVRRMPSLKEQPSQSTQFELPLRILLVTARPDDAGFVDPRGIARELLEEVSEQMEEGTISLEFLRPPTLAALRTRLSDTRQPPIHILHFDGHGGFGQELIPQDGLRLKGNGAKQGLLAFENEEGQQALVAAEELAQVLQDSGIRLAVLTACQSAVSAAEDAFSSVAARLIKSGIAAVVAMSASVLVASAARYVEAFYRALSTGTAVPIAQERARQALYDDPRRHLTRRYRDDEGEPVRLRDWWLPHYYQQRPLRLEPALAPVSAHKQKKPAQNASLPALSESMPAEPRYGFSGRALELLRIERALLGKKLVVIHGFGGMGKTALAREAADWFTRTGFYHRACFVSFEYGGDAAMLLSALGTFLDIYDGHYNPNDSKAALARIKPAIKKQRLLVIADNLESILPRGEATLEPALRSQLWDVLLELRKLGAGVLLTSRDTTFEESRLAPGRYVMYLPLEGLYSDDAYLLASHILTDLGIERAQAPYAELRALLAQLDHHPLAIQVVLPTLRERSLTSIRTQFAELLPTFTDDTTTGRNRSLLASLDYSLQRLSPEQRSLLSRLAVFEGGASEDDLLEITQIPAEEWAMLRASLEQAALLTAEQVHEAVIVPFLRFHPVLVPYLRWQAGATVDPELLRRYALRYAALARYLDREDFQHPQPIRALVRRELPNLRRALEFLLQEGEVDAASVMADGIAKFLTVFGMARERDQMRQRVAAAIAAKPSPGGETLTRAEYLREIGIAEDERERGNIRAAFTRLTLLLKRLEAQPQGTEVGPGSYPHSRILQELGSCLTGTRQYTAAEARVREALAILDALVQSQPENRSTKRLHADVLGDWGRILILQGHYAQARQLCEQALTEFTAIQDIRNSAATLSDLGYLALEQRDYAQANMRYQQALEQFRTLGEPAQQAVVWNQLGVVAGKQSAWAEAERCFRESLILREQQGNLVGVAMTCNQLGNVAQSAGRPAEAEGWYQGALHRIKQIDANSARQAIYLSNLADLLVDEVRAGRAAKLRLVEARNYAEQARRIREQPGVSAEIWNTFGILAKIADLQGNPQEGQSYRQQERESYAAFAGNRYHIQQQFASLITDIAAATRGEAQARAQVEAALPQLEDNGWHIRSAVEWIWAGERDWQVLTSDLDRQDALLILLVLEALSAPPETPPEEEEHTQEQLVAALPPSIREAIEQGDGAAFQEAVAALSPEEQERVVAILERLRRQNEGQGGADGKDFIERFEPLLQAVARVVLGDSAEREEVEGALEELGANGWHILGAVQRIWVGERDVEVLMAGLDEQDALLVRRVVDIVSVRDDGEGEG